MTVAFRALQPGELDHERMWMAMAALAAVAVALVWVAGMPAWLATSVVCPVKGTIGWPCAGCGSSRALAALFALDGLTAFRLNPLATAGALAAVVWLAYAATVLCTGLPRGRIDWSTADLRKARLASGIAILANWTYLVADGR